jgi:hypothetical protein
MRTVSSLAFAWPPPSPHRLGTPPPATAGGPLTTLQTSHHAADRSVALSRFDPGLSTGTSSFATGDNPCVSPTGRAPAGCRESLARPRHDLSCLAVESFLVTGARTAGRTSIRLKMTAVSATPATGCITGSHNRFLDTIHHERDSSANPHTASWCSMRQPGPRRRLRPQAGCRCGSPPRGDETHCRGRSPPRSAATTQRCPAAVCRREVGRAARTR